MPNLEAKKIPVWPTYCGNVSFKEKTSLSTSPAENCIVQLVSGKCTVICRDKQVPLPIRSMVMMGRNTTAYLEAEPGHDCVYTLLRYAHTYTLPNLDLNHLCLDISLVDSFLGQKGRFCTLSDREYIYLTMGALQYEWGGQEPERDQMILFLLYELFIKLSRSFHTHKRASGITYLTRARSYIQQHYNQDLLLDEVAQASGISRSYLTGLFSRYMQQSVVDYIQTIRCNHAAYLLSTTRFPTIDIAIDTGFNNRQHFARTFLKIYGVTPHQYRKTYQIQPMVLSNYACNFMLTKASI